MSDQHLPARRYVPEPLPAVHPGGNGPAPYELEGEQEENGIREWWGLFRRHWVAILSVTLIAGGLATYKALNDPAEYRSSAVIRLVDKNRMMAGGLGSGAMVAANLGDPILSQIEVLRSRSVTGMVVDALGLHLVPDSPEFPRSVIRDVEIAPGMIGDSVVIDFGAASYTLRGEVDATTAIYGVPARVAGLSLTVVNAPAVDREVFRITSREHAAARLQNGLLTERRDRTDLIDVGYTAHDPEMAQRIVNTIVERFQAFNAGTAQENARRRRLFIQEQLQQTDSAVRQAQLRLADFRRREKAFSSRETYAARQTGLMQLRSEREQLVADREVVRDALAGFSGQSLEERAEKIRGILSAPVLSTSPALARAAEQYLGYQVSYDTLTAGGRPRTNPEVQRVAALLANSQADVARALRDHLEGVETRVAVLDNLIRRSEADMQSLPSTDVEEVDLLAEVAHLTAVASQLRTEYQQAQIDEAVQAGQVEIVDPALSGVPVAAGRIRTVLFGIVLGLMLGGGFAVVLENANTSIRRKDEVLRVLRIPELAVIPRFTPADEGDGRRKFPIPFPLSKNGKHHARGSRGELIAAREPHSAAAEAYRTLRTNLIFSQSLHALRSVAVTSSAPSEGKSTTAANLAATFAQQGRRVLLVDCDLRKARLHKMFGVPREPGFTHLLLGLSPLSELVRETEVEGLQFLSSGTLPPNPGELVGGEEMQATLDRLSQEYDLVILDTPPLLAASDAAMLGRLVDGVLLVVRAGQTERDAAKQAVRQLAAARARLLGAVLNDPDSKVGQYGGHYQYEYYGEKV